MKVIEVVNGRVYINNKEYGRCFMGEIFVHWKSGKYTFNGHQAAYYADVEDLTLIAAEMIKLNKGLKN